MSGFLLIQIFHYIKNNSHFRLHKLTVAAIIPCIIMSSTLVNVGFTKSAAFSCLNRKENVVDSILCKESNKCLFYNAFRHMIQSTTKNNQC